MFPTGIGTGNILEFMQIVLMDDDAAGFVTAVDQVVAGCLREYSPASLILIKIDNWFGPRWLGFSGKIMGTLGVRWRQLTIPPFVPHRVISQRRFEMPSYEEVDAGEPLHVRQTSAEAMERNVSEVVPDTALVWYSGNSGSAGRGSVMVYPPRVYPSGADAKKIWYAEWQLNKAWHLSLAKGIKPAELQRLMGQVAP